jgi:hypothetical protein
LLLTICPQLKDRFRRLTTDVLAGFVEVIIEKVGFARPFLFLSFGLAERLPLLGNPGMGLVDYSSGCPSSLSRDIMESSMAESVAIPRSNASKADKAEATTKAANQIMSAEVDAREAKTRKLREARIAKEAADAEAAPPVETKRKRKSAAKVVDAA